MKAFFAKYSTLTHSLAGFWAVIVSAYTLSNPFRTAVNSTALSLYHALPAHLAAIVAGLFTLIAPLWAFYRNGEKPVAVVPVATPAKAQVLPTVVIALLLSGLMFTTTGCTSQQTIASLIATVGTATASLETLEGNATLAAKIKTDTAAATLAVTNWKSGSPVQDVVEALNLVQDDLNLLPLAGPDVALVDLAIGTVQEILNLLPSAPVTVSTSLKASPRRQVHLTKTPKKAEDFKKQWNAIASTNPTLSSAVLK